MEEAPRLLQVARQLAELKVEGWDDFNIRGHVGDLKTVIKRLLEFIETPAPETDQR